MTNMLFSKYASGRFEQNDRSTKWHGGRSVLTSFYDKQGAERIYQHTIMRQAQSFRLYLLNLLCSSVCTIYNISYKTTRPSPEHSNHTILSVTRLVLTTATHMLAHFQCAKTHIHMINKCASAGTVE